MPLFRAAITWQSISRLRGSRRPILKRNIHSHGRLLKKHRLTEHAWEKVIYKQDKRRINHELEVAENKKKLKEKPFDYLELSSKSRLWIRDASSPGTPFFLPAGTHVFLKLVDYLRRQHMFHGFEEIITPQLYKKELWQQSGHWDKYKDDMFNVKGGSSEAETSSNDEEYRLKPMNCPGHCIVYQSGQRSYRDLPIRYSEFSPLHRNEVSGSLSGLTRVRRFHQDDGHIFCRFDQIIGEVKRQLMFMEMTYATFGLEVARVCLSTPSEEAVNRYIGEADEWNTATEHLKTALTESGIMYETNVGEAAFYAPKIDIMIRDKNGKEHQTSTIQLDFQLPKRFDLSYKGFPASQDGETKPPRVHDPKSGEEADDLSSAAESVERGLKLSAQTTRPVMIHRALFGSVERFMALLIEHYQQRWPFWLTPKQVIIITITDNPKVVDYANELRRLFRNHRDGPGFEVDLDVTGESIKKKIARVKGSEGIKYNVLCFVGIGDVKSKTVDLDISGQAARNAVATWRHVEDIKPGSRAIRKKDTGNGIHVYGEHNSVRMMPEEFLEVMKRWVKHYV